MPTEQPRPLSHIYLPGHGAEEPHTRPKGGGGGDEGLPARDRAQHAAALEKALVAALAKADSLRAAPDPAATAGTPGFYLEFELPAQQVGVTEKLEKRKGQKIELVAVRPLDSEGQRVSATIFVPNSQRDYFGKKIEAYRTKETPTGKPQNEPLVASIETVRLAALRSLYTDSPDLFPTRSDRLVGGLATPRNPALVRAGFAAPWHCPAPPQRHLSRTRSGSGLGCPRDLEPHPCPFRHGC